MESSEFEDTIDGCRLRGAFFSTPSIFSEFRERGDFFDVNLFTDDGCLPAHKVILSACSDFFRDKLRRMQPTWNIGDPLMNGRFQCIPVMSAFYLSGVTHSDLEAILEFIYKGDVQLTVERLENFLATAQHLQVKGLLTDDVDHIQKEYQQVVRSAKTSAPMSTRKRLSKFAGKRASSISSGSTRSPIKKFKQEKDHADDDDIHVRIESADHWQLGDDEDDVGGGGGACTGDDEVLIDGQKARNFIQKVDGKFQCQLCDHSSNDKSNLVRHLKRRHTSPTHELCPHCGKTYKNKECLYNHVSSKRCIRGTITNPRDPSILMHLRFDPDEKKWICIECGNKYRQKVYAREHVVFKHLNLGKDGEIQETFNIPENVTKFVEFSPANAKWKCLSCSRLHSSAYSVTNHVRRKHLKDDNADLESNASDGESILGDEAVQVVEDEATEVVT